MLQIGRNGIHHYDVHHCPVLTPMAALEHIANNIEPQDSAWALSAEQRSRDTKTAGGDLVDAGAIARRAAPAPQLSDSARRQARSVTGAGDWR